MKYSFKEAWSHVHPFHTGITPLNFFLINQFVWQAQNTSVNFNCLQYKCLTKASDLAGILPLFLCKPHRSQWATLRPEVSSCVFQRGIWVIDFSDRNSDVSYIFSRSVGQKMGVIVWISGPHSSFTHHWNAINVWEESYIVLMDPSLTLEMGKVS